MCDGKSYGHAYLTSYGWTGVGTGLRKGAIDKPLAIAPKKNLSGLGRDRDDAFPFWDHLFAAASKAITIKVSSDDEDADDTEGPSSHADLRRTTTGIISNRRPISNTPASTSGGTTPNPGTDVDTQSRRLSLLATAKREAAKRSLYSTFFRGPVLGPDDSPREDTASHPTPSTFDSSSISAPVPKHVGEQDDIIGETKIKKRKREDKAESKKERKERKRLRLERKVEKSLAREKAKEKKNLLDDADRKARKHLNKGTRSEETQLSKMARKQTQKSLAGSEGNDLESATYTRKQLEKDISHKSRSDVADAPIPTTKKKRRRKDTPS